MGMIMGKKINELNKGCGFKIMRNMSSMNYPEEKVMMIG